MPNIQLYQFQKFDSRGNYWYIITTFTIITGVYDVMTYEMNIGSTDNSVTILKSAVGSGNEEDFLVKRLILFTFLISSAPLINVFPHDLPKDNVCTTALISIYFVTFCRWSSQHPTYWTVQPIYHSGYHGSITRSRYIYFSFFSSDLTKIQVIILEKI